MAARVDPRQLKLSGSGANSHASIVRRRPCTHLSAGAEKLDTKGEGVELAPDTWCCLRDTGLEGMDGEFVQVVEYEPYSRFEAYVCTWRGAPFLWPREQLVPVVLQ